MKPEKILMTLGVLICAFLGTMLVITNCNRPSPSYGGIDSTFVAAYMESVADPTFTSVDEIVTYRNDLETEDELNFEFLNIDPKILKNVASVCLKRTGSATKADIVAEYSHNSEIYNNLPEEGSITVEKAEVPDSGMGDNKPQNTVSFHEQDTTIDGHKAKILTRKEVQYE